MAVLVSTLPSVVRMKARKKSSTIGAELFLLRAHTTRSTQPPLFFIISSLNIKWNWWCVCESFSSIVQCVVVCIYMVRSPTRDIIQCMISRISCVSFIHFLFFFTAWTKPILLTAGAHIEHLARLCWWWSLMGSSVRCLLFTCYSIPMSSVFVRTIKRLEVFSKAR